MTSQPGKPPLTLIAIAVVYLSSEIALLLLGGKLSGLVRMAIYAVVFYFVFLRSRNASKIWIFVSVLSGIATAIASATNFEARPVGALLLALYAVFFFLSAAYMAFSPAMRAYLAASPTPIEI